MTKHGSRSGPVLEPIDRLALGTGSVICVAIVFALLSVGFNPLLPAYHYPNLLVYGAAWIFFIGFSILLALYRRRPDSPLRYLRGEYFDAGWQRNAKRALVYSLLLAVFGTLFSMGKRSIPLFNDYVWDSAFIELDATIHGGDAWQLLQPVLGYPAITFVIGWIYTAWVLLIYVGNFYFIFLEKDAASRARFVLAYLVTWTSVGLLGATALASVGPCFLEPITGNTHFAEQMAYLRQADATYPVAIIQIQQNLLDMYFNQTAMLGAGISAMPSMHVAEATLVFLAMLGKPPWVRAFFGLFLLAIMIGSVHLALHYAVDGYVAIVMTVAIWLLTGKLVAAWKKPQGFTDTAEPRPAPAG